MTTPTIDLEAYGKRLRTRRSELDERVHRVERELDEPRDPDVEERATEREFDEVLEAEGLAGLKEMKAIDAALKRIEDGSYGICVGCGKAISPERLDAVSHAPLCRHCSR